MCLITSGTSLDGNTDCETMTRFDLELGVQKTIHWINEAGKAGCKLVAFPEVCMYTATTRSRAALLR